MEVILLADVKKVGKKNQTVNVSDGFAVNFLIKKKLAVPVTKKSVEILETQQENARQEEIRKKDADLKGQMITQGTTPRRLTDLIGSLCDLTSGSGDKGTPVVFIQGYFDNLSND